MQLVYCLVVVSATRILVFWLIVQLVFCVLVITVTRIFNTDSISPSQGSPVPSGPVPIVDPNDNLASRDKPPEDCRKKNTLAGAQEARESIAGQTGQDDAQ